MRAAHAQLGYVVAQSDANAIDTKAKLYDLSRRLCVVKKITQVLTSKLESAGSAKSGKEALLHPAEVSERDQVLNGEVSSLKLQ